MRLKLYYLYPLGFEHLQSNILEFELLYLAAAGEREPFYKQYVFRNLVMGYLTFAELLYVALVKVCPLLRNYECTNFLAVFL